MAQAGFTPIQLYYSTTASAVPTAGNLASGELAINISDGKLYYKNASNVVTLLATAGSVSSQWVTSGSDIYYNTGNVGIGTSSPGYPLQVRRAGGAGSLGITVDSVGSINRVTQYYSIGDTTAVTTGHAWYTRNASATDNLSLLLDNSGNLGLGVTPSAWDSTLFKVAQIGVTGAFISGRANAVNQAQFGLNAYYDGSSYKYVTTGNSTRYEQNTGAHYWYSAASGTAGNAITFTQAMTLDANGNLGVGVTSPGAKLEIGSLGVFRMQTGSTVFNTTPTAGATDTLVWNTSNAGSGFAWNTNSVEKVRISPAGDLLVGITSAPLSAVGRGNITINGSSTAIMNLTIGGTSKGYIFHDDNSMEVWNSDNSYMRFGTNNAERVRISAAGGFSVGTTSDPGAGAIYATGNITAYFSDNRLKTRLGGIENALDKVEKLSGFYYEANETAQALGYKPKREVGVSAQEVQAVLPEVVSPAPVDQQYLTVDYERLVPLLIEAIKELRAEVRALKGV